MQTTAWFFQPPQSDGGDMSILAQACAEANLRLEDMGPVPDPEVIGASVPSVPGIVFLPAVEEDCMGVKLVQNVLTQSPPHHLTGPLRVVVLYASALPSARFLRLAFREGADDVIALNDPDGAPAIHVRRAARVLSGRLEWQRNGGEMGHRVEALRAQVERLERRCARWEERLLALASAAHRMATGELRLSDASPVLLVVSPSQSQAATAAEVAEPMGFQVHTADTGQTGLQQIVATRPSVILTGGTLPDMDGSAFARSARDVLGRRAVIIIAWSSNADAEERLLAPDGGIDDFVLKSAGRETRELLTAALLGALR